MIRSASISRMTKETDIHLTLNLDGTGQADIQTGLGFLDHMLQSLAQHGRLDLTLKCKGDLQVDEHHTVEDCAIVLGQALDKALGERKQIMRFGYAYAPLDEALARAVMDLVTRPSAVINLGLKREKLGEVACENIPHFFQSLAMNARMTLHIDCLRGDNDHHRAEAAFKAFALALRFAVQEMEFNSISTKGTL